MSVGIIMYGASTVYLRHLRTILRETTPPPWAFPLTCTGTLSIFAGMFLCAHLINNESNETFLKRISAERNADSLTVIGNPNNETPTTDGEVFWLQKAQTVGDQTFKAYIGRSHESKRYIKSTRATLSRQPSLRKRVELYCALGLSIIGFVFQFVGLRYLHASVALANLGSTLIMSVLRATLRTQHPTALSNELDQYDRLRSKDFELTHLARILSDHDMKTFDLYVSQQPMSLGPPDQTTELQCSGERLVMTYTRLLSLVNGGDGWIPAEIRAATIRLKSAIEGVAEYIGKHSDLEASWLDGRNIQISIVRMDGYGADLKTSLLPSWSEPERQCRLRTESSPILNNNVETITMRISQPIPANPRWIVDILELEALLTLVYSSRLSRGTAGPSVSRRLVSDFDSHDAASKAAAFSEWEIWMTDNPAYAKVKSDIHKQPVSTEPVPVQVNPSTMPQTILQHDMNEYFGWHAFTQAQDNKTQTQPSMLFQHSNGSELVMCTQDVFISYLQQMLPALRPTDASDIALPDLHVEHGRCSSRRLDDLCDIFMQNSLGSRMDALACIYPALKQAHRHSTLDNCWPSMQGRFDELWKNRKILQACRLYTWFISYDNPQSDALAVELALKILIDYSVRFEVSGPVARYLLFLIDPSRSCKVSKSTKCQIFSIYDFITRERRKAIPDSSADAEKGNIRYSETLLSYGLENLNIDVFPLRGSDWLDINRERRSLTIKYLLSMRDALDSEIYDSKIASPFLPMRRTPGDFPTIDYRDTDGRTALSWACQHGDYELALWLTRKGASSSTEDNYRRTPLFYASLKGHVNLLHALLPCYWSGASHSTLITAAMLTDQRECVNEIVKHHTNGMGDKLRSLLQERNDSESTFLHLAVKHGALACFSSFIDKVSWSCRQESECIMLHKNDHGQTVFDLIRISDKKGDFARYLLQADFGCHSAAVVNAIKDTVMAILPQYGTGTALPLPKWWNVNERNSDERDRLMTADKSPASQSEGGNDGNVVVSGVSSITHAMKGSQHPENLHIRTNPSGTGVSAASNVKKSVAQGQQAEENSSRSGGNGDVQEVNSSPVDANAEEDLWQLKGSRRHRRRR